MCKVKRNDVQGEGTIMGSSVRKMMEHCIRLALLPGRGQVVNKMKREMCCQAAVCAR